MSTQPILHPRTPGELELIMPRLKHPKTGHVTLAITPREIVQLKAAGYVEEKPEKPKPQSADSTASRNASNSG